MHAVSVFWREVVYSNKTGRPLSSPSEAASTIDMNQDVTTRAQPHYHTTHTPTQTMAKRSPTDSTEVAIESENRVNGSDNASADEMDDEVHQQQRQRKKDKKKKKKRKVRIMTASGQTDADRRVLRRRQRELLNDISFDAPAAAASAGGGGNNDSEEDDSGVLFRPGERCVEKPRSSAGDHHRKTPFDNTCDS